jgi:DNA-binding beta-propeller fold protein YncE
LDINGGTNQTTFLETAPLLFGQYKGLALGGEDNGIALASDANSNVYMGNSDGTVKVFYTKQGIGVGLLNVGFGPSGVAVDNLRGRVYIANYNGNQILVYSTAGVWLHTIQ